MTFVDIGIVIVLLSFVPLAIGIVGLWITAIRFMIFQIWQDHTEQLGKDQIMGIINYAYGNLLTIHQQDEVNDIIRQAIEENDDPFTTDADIRYFETQDYLMRKGLII